MKQIIMKSILISGNMSRKDDVTYALLTASFIMSIGPSERLFSMHWWLLWGVIFTLGYLWMRGLGAIGRRLYRKLYGNPEEHH
ncbi:hypothetical protein KEM60_01488 [Austwickia sp. TVS 96-490-7B]|nr:hypothetical protein [Austwickia sp. TVS 96-490-7B]